jgi:hypothetical protein
VGFFGDDLNCYLGFDDKERDVRARMRIMEEAVRVAHEQSSKDPSVLKIFVAPEFYWRGPNGAYDAKTIIEHPGQFNTVAEICGGLEEMVADEKYENWLFVFGTIIAATRSTSVADFEKVDVGDMHDYLFFNFGESREGG